MRTVALCIAVLSVSIAVSLAASVAGCAGTDPAADAPRPRIQGRSLALLPIVDRSGALSASETARLRDEIVEGLEDLGKATFVPGRPVRAFPLVEAPTQAAVLLEVEVQSFDPLGSPALALTVGLGAGRPAYEIELRLATAPGATTTAGKLGDLVLERASRRWETTPAVKGGPRRAMIESIASEAVGFVRRRR